MPASRLLIVIADRCPWHVLVIDAMSAQLRQQGIACGVIGLVEQGILDAPNIAGLRRLADKTGGAWDLANGRELSQAIYTLGLHLYRKLGHAVTTCEIVSLDHGHLVLFRDAVETGVRLLTEALAAEKQMTSVLFHWRSVPASRLHLNPASPAVRPWHPQELDRATTGDVRGAVASRPGQAIPDGPGALVAASPIPTRRSARRPRLGLSGTDGPGSPTDRLIQWGLWLSGGALLSALSLLAKK